MAFLSMNIFIITILKIDYQNIIKKKIFYNYIILFKTKKKLVYDKKVIF
jgi:hypothetical protein